MKLFLIMILTILFSNFLFFGLLYFIKINITHYYNVVYSYQPYIDDDTYAISSRVMRFRGGIDLISVYNVLEDELDCDIEIISFYKISNDQGESLIGDEKVKDSKLLKLVKKEET